MERDAIRAMERLRGAGYAGAFTPIEEGARLYWKRLERQLSRAR